MNVIRKLNKKVTDSYLWWRYNWECKHNSVWVFFTDFGDEECSHSWSGTATKWVRQLESLKTVTAFTLLPDNIQYRVYKFSTFCVMSLSPVVSCTTLSENKVVWSEDLAKWSRSDRVHGTRLQINKNCTWHIFSPYNTTRQTIVFFFITLYCDMCFCIGNMVELAASISGPRLIYGGCYVTWSLEISRHFSNTVGYRTKYNLINMHIKE